MSNNNNKIHEIQLTKISLNLLESFNVMVERVQKQRSIDSINADCDEKHRSIVKISNFKFQRLFDFFCHRSEIRLY